LQPMVIIDVYVLLVNCGVNVKKDRGQT